MYIPCTFKNFFYTDNYKNGNQFNKRRNLFNFLFYAYEWINSRDIKNLADSTGTDVIFSEICNSFHTWTNCNWLLILKHWQTITIIYLLIIFNLLNMDNKRDRQRIRRKMKHKHKKENIWWFIQIWYFFCKCKISFW